MFIKNAAFKKMLKKAYDGIGLKVSRDTEGEGLILAGSTWIIWLEYASIPKKALSAIIELTGKLPEPGESFSSTSEGNQYEIDQKDCWDINSKFDQSEIEIKITKMLCECDSTLLRVIQTDQGKILTINEIFIDMISRRELDVKTETEPEGPVMQSLESQVIYWRNEKCTLAACLCVLAGEDDRKILNLLEKENLQERLG